MNRKFMQFHPTLTLLISCLLIPFQSFSHFIPPPPPPDPPSFAVEVFDTQGLMRVDPNGPLTYTIDDKIKFEHENDSVYTDFKFVYHLKDSVGDSLLTYDPGSGNPASFESFIYDVDNLPKDVTYLTNGTRKELKFSMGLFVEIPKSGSYIEVHYEVWAKDSGSTTYELLIGQTSSDYYTHTMDTLTNSAFGGQVQSFVKRAGENIETQSSIYPNPFSSQLIFATDSQEGGTLEIRSLTGKLVLTAHLPSTESMLKLNTREITPGIYIGMWTSGTKKEIFKLFKRP